MKESFFSIDLLIAIAAVLSIALVGYNAFLMPNYAPASITFPAEVQSEPAEEATALIVNLNTADSVELQRISGIGPAMAEKILAYRERVGVITDVRELLEVSGIGEATLEKLAPYLAVEGQGTE